MQISVGAYTPSLSLSLPTIESRTDTGTDLAFFLRPGQRFPGVIRAAIDVHDLSRREFVTRLEPSGFEVVTFFWRGALLIERSPHHRARLSLTRS